MLKVYDDEGETIILLTDLDESLSSDDVHKKLDEWEKVNSQDVDMSACGDVPFLGYVVGSEDDPFGDEDSTPDKTQTFDQWMKDLQNWCKTMNQDYED